MPGLYCWFRTATYLGYSVMLCVFSLFLILVFEILVPYIFDVVCHSPYFEEEKILVFITIEQPKLIRNIRV